MATDPESNGRYAASAQKVVVGLILLPLLPIAVAVNFVGVADRLSVLPGIKNGGGTISGFSTLVMIALVLAATVGLAAAVSGTDLPVVNGENGNPATETSPISTPTATPTPTATTTPSPTAAMTSTPESSDLEAFKSNYRNRLQETMENETLTGVPVLGLEYRETDNNTNELWVVYWECEGYEHARTQRWNIAVDYANTAGTFDGNQPAGLRSYAVLNLKSHNHSTTYIPTSSAEAAYNETMDRDTYTENWSQRLRDPTETETEIASQIAANDIGEGKAEEIFTKERSINETDRGCPAGAEPANADK